MSASHEDLDDDNSAGHSGGHDHGRWAVPYGDMLTVLMALFIVLYAMSSVDVGKFDQLAHSLKDGFNSPVKVVQVSPNPGAAETVPRKDASPLAEAKKEVASLEALKEAVKADLATKGMASAVEFKIDERGLTFKLLGTDTFFQPNSATLTGQAGAIISAITPHLALSPNNVSVEGHADARASTYPYQTNWDLASARATTVLRYMAEIGGIPGIRLSATSFGDAHPQVAGSTAEAYAANRRVDVVVLSNASDAAKALIPSVIDGTAGTKTPTKTTPTKNKTAPKTAGH
jgi:chemotaxis protein MotB